MMNDELQKSRRATMGANSGNSSFIIHRSSLVIAGALALLPRCLHEGRGFRVGRHDGVEIGGDVLKTRAPIFVEINAQVALLNVARRGRHDQRIANLMSVEQTFGLAIRWSCRPRRATFNRSEEHTSELQSRFDLV